MHPGRQTRGDKTINEIHVIVPEEKKTQTRKALKIIHHSLPHPHYQEGIQWRGIENIVDRSFTMTEQSSIVAKRMKYKQSTFLQNLCSTTYKHIKNIHAKVIVEPYLPLSNILTNLRSHKDSARKLFVMV